MIIKNVALATLIAVLILVLLVITAGGAVQP
jgi:hypothetical protein